jgi:hypothetical protein
VSCCAAGCCWLLLVLLVHFIQFPSTCCSAGDLTIIFVIFESDAMFASYISTLYYANHLGVFSCSIFLFVNFFRAFYEDRLHRRELVYICDWLLFSFNILFFLDALLYWCAYIQQRQTGIIKASQYNYTDGNILLNQSNNSRGLNISWFLSTFSNGYYIWPVEGISEWLNVLGCLLYLLSSLFPLFSYINLSEVAEAHLDQATYIVDCIAMVVFCIDSYYYLRVWCENYQRDLTERIIKSPNSWSNFSSYSLRDAYFWTNCINIIACLCYFVSVSYGLYIRLLMPTNGIDTTPIKHREAYSDFTLWQRMIFNSSQQQRALMFIGDILFFFCAIFSEIGFYNEFFYNNKAEKFEIIIDSPLELHRKKQGSENSGNSAGFLARIEQENSSADESDLLQPKISFSSANFASVDSLISPLSIDNPS